MRVALIHYHQRPGGVTRVMADQVEALRGAAATLIVTGEPPDADPGCPVAVVPSLAYDRDRGGPADAEAAAAEVLRAVGDHWPAGATLLHFHNPTLGKNRAMSGVIRALQARGQTVVLQVHDLAEDGRPELYSPDPYPEDCPYVVINSRDRRLLLRCGLREEGLHYLPNAVRPLAAAAGSKGERRLFVYPVRAIRRKNVGEAILLSLLLPAGCSLAITLEPTGPLDAASLGAWKAFARERGLAVGFAAGVGSSLESLLGDCRAVVTTSIKEGFGFAFLEPWTAGLPLQGRYLEETCPDFEQAGVRLDHLYRGIRVPAAWTDRAALRRKREACRRARLEAYGIRDEGAAAGPPEEAVDFGMLSEDLQRQALAAVLDDPGAKRRLLDDNPGLARVFDAGLPADLISENRRVVLERFSIEATRERLQSLYAAATGRAVRQSLDKAALVRELNGGDLPLLLCPDSYA